MSTMSTTTCAGNVGQSDQHPRRLRRLYHFLVDARTRQAQLRVGAHLLRRSDDDLIDL